MAAALAGESFQPARTTLSHAYSCADQGGTGDSTGESFQPASTLADSRHTLY